MEVSASMKCPMSVFGGMLTVSLALFVGLTPAAQAQSKFVEITFGTAIVRLNIDTALYAIESQHHMDAGRIMIYEILNPENYFEYVFGRVTLREEPDGERMARRADFRMVREHISVYHEIDSSNHRHKEWAFGLRASLFISAEVPVLDSPLYLLFSGFLDNLEMDLSHKGPDWRTLRKMPRPTR